MSILLQIEKTPDGDYAVCVDAQTEESYWYEYCNTLEEAVFRGAKKFKELEEENA